MNSIGSSRMFMGLVIILLGAWLLLDRLDIVYLGPPWRWAPSIFILFALWSLVTKRSGHIMGPVIVIAIAGFVQLAIVVDDFNHIARDWWPALLILVGLGIIFGTVRGRGESTGSGTDLRLFAAFAGHEVQNASADFRGGQLTALFGGFEVDLRSARITNRPAVVDVTCAFGGGEIRVPEDWNIENRSVAIFGATEDSRSRSTEPSGEVDLVISGVVLFGGIEIKS
ncbi:hypothetical protein ACFL6T_02125 [Candidatus Zixiibacteriota bacterium]